MTQVASSFTAKCQPPTIQAFCPCENIAQPSQPHHQTNIWYSFLQWTNKLDLNFIFRSSSDDTLFEQQRIIFKRNYFFLIIFKHINCTSRKLCISCIYDMGSQSKLKHFGVSNNIISNLLITYQLLTSYYIFNQYSVWYSRIKLILKI